jgi:hypothetical protein
MDIKAKETQDNFSYNRHEELITKVKKNKTSGNYVNKLPGVK